MTDSRAARQPKPLWPIIVGIVVTTVLLLAEVVVIIGAIVGPQS